MSAELWQICPTFITMHHDERTIVNTFPPELYGLHKRIVQCVNRHDPMLATLRKFLAWHENRAEELPGDAGCIDCTAGTVPNNRNTGLCAYHEARNIIAAIDRPSWPPK